ncbi:protein phosphatase [Blastomyces parvus]|uniref:Protein phosphatase n=1 Tax=Blastomyces parvus TaxID=2060905 RepID=A0A2B7XMH0_9EURO|nr:protein phosphatase [Blastomyces parvus]
MSRYEPPLNGPSLSSRYRPKPIHRSGFEPVDENTPDSDSVTRDDESPPAETPLRAESPWRETVYDGGSRSLRRSIGPMPSPISSSSSYPRQPRRPLLDYVTNGWTATRRKYSKLGPNMKAHNSKWWPAWMNGLFTLLSAPRVRRYIIVYVILVWICLGSWVGLLSPRLKEHHALSRALDPKTRGISLGWFGSNALPKFDDLVYLRSLDTALLPSENEDSPQQKRVIVIGDVHGCLDELETLLQKVNFDPKNRDHLIFTGDLIAKGPKSTGVVDLARKYRASCVRGNHEDRVLLTRRDIKAAGPARYEHPSDNEPDQGDDDVEPGIKERTLARELNDEQAGWLSKCPVILKVGSIKGMGEVVVVHGGLVPGVELENQDPSTVMSMRTIDLSSHVPSASSKGVSWTKLFNKHQSMLAASRESAPAGEKYRYSPSTTVIYGHDPHSSPALKKYTKGLDTGCVKGGKLSAMIIGDGGINRVESVKCKDYTTKIKAKR